MKEPTHHSHPPIQRMVSCKLSSRSFGNVAHTKSGDRGWRRANRRHPLSPLQIVEWRQRMETICTLSSTGWRRLRGCLKLQVIFCKRATNYRALLWKMTYEDKASYDSTPPCRSQIEAATEDGDNFDRKKPPPRGGFLFTMFPDQEP